LLYREIKQISPIRYLVPLQNDKPVTN